MKNINIILIIVAFILISCDDSDKVKNTLKDGSVESTIQIDHLSNGDQVMKTTSKVWIKGAIVKTIVHCDTLPTLGYTTQEAENNEGETKKVQVKKDYEIYLTVQ